MSRLVSQARPTVVLILAGILLGCLTALMMLLVNFTLETFAGWLAGLSQNRMRSMAGTLSILAPIAGALTIGWLFNRMPESGRQSGVSHILMIFRQKSPRVPLRNAWVQAVGGMTMLSSGISGGSLGPMIHLASAGTRLLPSRLTLSDDQIRALILCAIATVVGTIFGLPLVGVVFALELTLFIPGIAGILAILASSLVGNYLYALGSGRLMNKSMSVPNPEFAHLPVLDLLVPAAYVGMTVAATGFLFLAVTRLFSARRLIYPFWIRALIAGIVTSAMALIDPGIMGLGLAQLDAILEGSIVWQAALVFLIAKLVASAACLGLLMPVGIFAPALLIGAACGSFFGAPEVKEMIALSVPPLAGNYAFFGMWAMVAVLFRTPLMALLGCALTVGSLNAFLVSGVVVLTAFAATRYIFRAGRLYGVGVRP